MPPRVPGTKGFRRVGMWAPTPGIQALLPSSTQILQRWKQMNSLGLKLYYLRTRVRSVTQMVMARELGIRQATISNLEQDISQPSLPLLRVLCEYFDVTPTYLLDAELPLQLSEGDRWSKRQGLITTGQYLEVEEKALHEIGEGRRLVALLPGTIVYDEDAAKLRAAGKNELADAQRIELGRRLRREAALKDELEQERTASRLRRRGISQSKAESMANRQSGQ